MCLVCISNSWMMMCFGFFVSSFCVSFFSLSFFFCVVAKIPFFLLNNEKEISSSLFKRRDLVSFWFFVGATCPSLIFSLTNIIIMFALTTQFAGVQVVSKTNAPKKSVNKVVSVSFKVFSRVVYPPLSREGWRRSLMNFLFFFHSPDGSTLRWMMNVRDEMISRCHLLY